MHRAIFLLLLPSAFAPAIAGDGVAGESYRAGSPQGAEQSAIDGQARQRAMAERPPRDQRHHGIFATQRADRVERADRIERAHRIERTERIDRAAGIERADRSEQIERSSRSLPDSRRGIVARRGPNLPKARIDHRSPPADSIGSTLRRGRLDRGLSDPASSTSEMPAGLAAEGDRGKRIRPGDTVRIVREHRAVVAAPSATSVDVQVSAPRSTDRRRHQRGWVSSPEAGATATLSGKVVEVELARPVSDRHWTNALRSGSPRRAAGDSGQVADRRHWTGSDHHRQWTIHWRDDHRFDWRGHRNQHRLLFRRGFYRDPFGFGYQRFLTGWSIWPAYYRSSYWISDPSSYRLPPAYRPYRWVRYHDDALLIDLDSGEVVDVIYNFFW